MTYCKVFITCAILILITSTSALAQNNACFGADPQGNVTNPKAFNAILVEHNATNAAGQPVVNNYTLNVMDGTTTATSVTIQKNQLSLVPGTPANCYFLALPQFSGLQPNKLYKFGMITNGPTQSSSMAVSSQSFFLEGAPSAPQSLRFSVLNILSRMYQAVLSTTRSKSWFKPIGK